MARLSITLVASNILIPIAIITFAKGFFPYKPFLPGSNSFSKEDVASNPNAPFDKVVFMVVDALRRFGIRDR
jgi:ethanolaminephosphotransferase